MLSFHGGVGGLACLVLIVFFFFGEFDLRTQCIRLHYTIQFAQHEHPPFQPANASESA